MEKNLLIQKWLALYTILLLVGSCSLPVIAQDYEKSFVVSNGNWWYVGGSGPGNFTEIQDAINAASDGDVVFVFNGTYVGHLNINKSISLFGEEKNSTIVSGFVAYTVSIISDGVTMSGFTIRNGKGRGEGVRIDSNFNTFSDNKVEIPNDDVRIFGDNNSIIGNSITGDTIYMSGDSNSIAGNIITNDEYGILLTNSWGNIISENAFVDSGLFLSDETIWRNSVMNNTVNGRPMIYLDDASDLVFDGDAGQIILVACTNITVQNQEVHNTTVGIQTVGCTSCIITGNTVQGNRYGMCLNGQDLTICDNIVTDNYGAIRLSGDRNTISENIISRNDGALYLYASDSNTILTNTITSNYDGILLDYGSDSNHIVQNIIMNNVNAILLSGDRNSITGNTIVDNEDDGVRLYGLNNTVFGNTISTNKYGIRLVEDSDHNSIFNNTVRNNTCAGISIDAGCFHNSIYHNNFLENSQNGYSEAVTIWENGYPSGGNYWSDYTGVDRNGDGLGDEPYAISGVGNQDGYPFMEPNGWFQDPISQKVVMVGKIINLSSLEEYLRFEAVKTRILSFQPLSLTKYASGEEWVISTNYQGLVRPSFIIALCTIEIRS